MSITNNNGGKNNGGNNNGGKNVAPKLTNEEQELVNKLLVMPKNSHGEPKIKGLKFLRDGTLVDERNVVYPRAVWDYVFLTGNVKSDPKTQTDRCNGYCFYSLSDIDNSNQATFDAIVGALASVLSEEYENDALQTALTVSSGKRKGQSITVDAMLKGIKTRLESVLPPVGGIKGKFGQEFAKYLEARATNAPTPKTAAAANEDDLFALFS